MEAIAEIEGIKVIHLEGNIQQLESEELEEQLYNLIEMNDRQIVVDLTRATNLCSYGLGLLVSFKKLLNDQKGDLRVIVAGGQIWNLMKVTMTDKILEPSDSLEEALSYFS